MQEDKVDLSIIIPCHNLEGYIDKMLESLERQIFAYSVEIYFICDSCTDKTRDIIVEWAKNKNQFIGYLLEAEVHSCGLARNVALDYVKGDYIWFMDGDDWLMDEWAIEKVITSMKVTNADILSFDYEAPNFQYKGHPAMVWQYCFKHNFIAGRRFKAIQPHEDRDFMQEVFEDEPKIMSFKEKLYYYNYLREGSNMWQVFHNGEVKT